jgi:hypothetical protein
VKIKFYKDLPSGLVIGHTYYSILLIAYTRSRTKRDANHSLLSCADRKQLSFTSSLLLPTIHRNSDSTDCIISVINMQYDINEIHYYQEAVRLKTYKILDSFIQSCSLELKIRIFSLVGFVLSCYEES